MDQKILIRIHKKLLRNRSTGKYSCDRLNASATNRQQQDHRSSSVRKSELPPILKTSTCTRSLQNLLSSWESVAVRQLARITLIAGEGLQNQASAQSLFRSLYFSLANILPISFKTNGPKLLINFLLSFNFLASQITFTLNSPL
jgi:hypothetical protein